MKIKTTHIIKIKNVVPSAWNTCLNAKEENKERLLTITKNLIVNLKLVV